MENQAHTGSQINFDSNNNGVIKKNYNKLKGPKIKTKIPGPISSNYLGKQSELESNARTYPRNIKIAIRQAQGPFIEDVDDNIFIDFLTGAGALVLGHNHPEIVEKVKHQLEICTHSLDIPTPVKYEFQEFILSKLPGNMKDEMKIHFCGPTGADAVEAAIKLCKTYTKRGNIVSFQGGYHGSTHGTMALSGIVMPKRDVNNLMPEVYFFPFAYCYRCPLSLSPQTCNINCAKYLKNSLYDPHSGIPKPAGVILEMVQGEGGSIPALREFVREIRDITNELSIPFIVDEIQTGIGRTGTWFAFEHYGIVPDVIVLSKALGGIGMPISVILYHKKMDIWEAGAHIGTFRGNQLAFVAGIEAMRIIERDGILDNVRVQGDYIMRRLMELKRKYSFIGDVRGLGLMIGIEIIDPDTKQPSRDLAAALHSRAISKGLIFELGGRWSSVIRLLPPLNIDRNVIDDALQIIEESMESVQ